MMAAIMTRPLTASTCHTWQQAPSDVFNKLQLWATQGCAPKKVLQAHQTYLVAVRSGRDVVTVAAPVKVRRRDHRAGDLRVAHTTI